MKTINIFYLLMYDITNDKIIQKVARKLTSFGFERINYSVWLGWVNPMEKGNLKIDLQTLLHNESAKGSKLYIVPLNTTTLGKMRSITGHKPRQLDYWLGKTKNVFF